MRRSDRSAVRAVLPCAVALIGLSSGSSNAYAQAWVPPANVGILSIGYQHIDNTNHRLTDGTLLDGYDSVSRSMLLSFDYAVTDRFSFSIALPYVGSKYTGPEPSFFGLPIDDCFCWNNGWQDVNATARYNLVNDAFALTPSVSIGVPSHDYAYSGEAVLGRNLNETRIGIDAGLRLDAVSPRLSVSGRYAYAFVEEVLDLANNRSNMALEAGFLATRRLSTRVGFLWQRSHGGLRTSEFTSDEYLEQFDRLLRDNNFHILGGVAYSFPRFDVFASYVHYADGTDTHVGRAITTGISWPFQTR